MVNKTNMKKYIVSEKLIIEAESEEMARQYFKEMVSESSNDNFEVKEVNN